MQLKNQLKATFKMNVQSNWIVSE